MPFSGPARGQDGCYYPKQGQSQQEATRGPIRANGGLRAMEMLEPDDVERLGLDGQSKQAQREQDWQDDNEAPPFTPEGWEGLIRAAGLQPREEPRG